MFLKNTISLEEDDDFSYLNEDFPSQFIFIPKTDHNINLFLKSKINAYLNIPLPNLENKDTNKIKEEEEVLFLNNISLSENTLKSSPIEIKDEINNDIIIYSITHIFSFICITLSIVFPNESSAKKKL